MVMIPLPKCRTIQHNLHSASFTLFMNNDTKARWDEARREQFGATATIVFTLASAAIAYISSLLTEDKAQFGGAATCFFLWTVITFIISLGLGVAAMVTRLEDFRATAQIVRLRYSSDAEDQAAVVRLRDRASSFGTNELLSALWSKSPSS
jgi:ATP/ADP translocase